MAVAAQMTTSPGDSILTGRRIGAYQIQTLLGAGGMGEVYRARDTKLERDVAIKILPRVFITDPDRLARFEREARMLAALNHPHIGAIYGVEEAEGLRALVLELVEGETLADRLRRDPVPVAEALTVARQVADGLDAAHEKGIIHRDLKPANIKVTPDGTKLLVALSGSPMAPPGTDESKLPPPDRTADGIGVVDIAARKVTTVLTSGSDPEQISLSADGSKVFVSNEDAGVASIIDVATNKIVGEVKVGGEPEGVTTSPNGQWVYVTSEEDNQIAVIDTASNKVIKMFEVGARPRSSVFLPDSSRAYVTAENGGTVHVVDTKTHSVVKTLKITGEMARPMGAVASHDGRRVYVTTGRGTMLLAIDTAKDEVVGSVKVGTRPWGVEISPDGKRLYTANGPSNDVSVVDADTMTVIATVSAGRSPWGVAIK